MDCGWHKFREDRYPRTSNLDGANMMVEEDGPSMGQLSKLNGFLHKTFP